MDFSFINFLPFIIFGLALLFGGHYFIYRSLISVFNISGLFKSGLAAFFIILPAGFFFASFIVHISQSPITKFIYIITASWLGIAINLLLAAIFIWLISWLMNLAGLNFNRLIFGLGLFSVAVIFSAYGFRNAFHPQIKNLEVKIKNLPAAWQGKTIIQLSDVHLGQVHSPAFMQSVADKVNAQNPDLILITGDLLDGMDGNLDGFAGPLNSLRAKQGIFFVTGNHETYLGLNNALDVLRKTDIKVLNDQFVDINGLQVVGISFPSPDSANIKGDSKNTAQIIASLPNLNKTEPIILMHHAPTNLDQAKKAGVALQLSGHTHAGQIWPFKFFPWLIFGQYYYGLHTMGDFSIYTTSGIGTWGPPMRTTGAPEIPVFKLQ